MFKRFVIKLNTLLNKDVRNYVHLQCHASVVTNTTFNRLNISANFLKRYGTQSFESLFYYPKFNPLLTI